MPFPGTPKSRYEVWSPTVAPNREAWRQQKPQKALKSNTSGQTLKIYFLPVGLYNHLLLYLPFA